MKKIYIFLCAILILFVISFVLIFNFGVLNNTFEKNIKKFVNEELHKNIDITGFKLKWNYIEFEKAELFEKNNEKILQINEFKTNISFFELFSGYLYCENIKCKNINFNYDKKNWENVTFLNPIPKVNLNIFPIVYANQAQIDLFDVLKKEFIRKAQFDSLNLNIKQNNKNIEILKDAKLNISTNNNIISVSLNGKLLNSDTSINGNIEYKKEKYDVSVSLNGLDIINSAEIMPENIKNINIIKNKLIKGIIDINGVIKGDIHKLSFEFKNKINSNIDLNIKAENLNYAFNRGNIDILLDEVKSEQLLQFIPKNILKNEKNIKLNGKITTAVSLKLNNKIPEINGSIIVDSFSLKNYSKIPVNIDSIDANIKVNSKKVNIDKLSIIVGNNELKASGTVSDYMNDPLFNIKIDSDKLKTDNIMAIIPSTYSKLLYNSKIKNGFLNLNAKINGTKTKPDISAKLKLNNLNITNPLYLKKGLSELNADIIIEKDKLNFDVSSKILKGSLHIKGKINDLFNKKLIDSNIEFKDLDISTLALSLKNIENKNIKKYFNEISAVSGNLSGNSKINGKIIDKKIKYSANIDLNRFNFKETKLVPINIIDLNSKINITPEKIDSNITLFLKADKYLNSKLKIAGKINTDLKNMNLDIKTYLNKDNINISGEISDISSDKRNVDLNIKTDNLNLDNILSSLPKKYLVSLKGIKLTGNIAENINLKGAPKWPIDILGDISLKKVNIVYSEYFKNKLMLSGKCSINKDDLTSKKLLVSTNGMNSNITLDIKNILKKPKLNIHLNGDISNVNSVINAISDKLLKKEYKIYSPFGKLKLNVQLKGEIDKLNWKVNSQISKLSVNKIGLLPISINNISGKLFLDQYKLNSKNLKLKLANISIPIKISSNNIKEMKGIAEIGKTNLNLNNILNIISSINKEYSKLLKTYKFGGNIEIQKIKASYNKELDILGNIKLNNVSCKAPTLKYPVERISGNIFLTKENLKLKDIGFSIMNSPGVINGAVKLKDLKTGFVAMLNNISLQKIIELLNMQKSIKMNGNANISVDIDGPVSDIKSKAALVSKGFRLKLIPEKPQDKPMQFAFLNFHSNVNYKMIKENNNKRTIKVEIPEIKMNMFGGNVIGNSGIQWNGVVNSKNELNLDEHFKYNASIGIINVDAKQFFDLNPHLGKCPTGKVTGKIDIVSGIGTDFNTINGKVFFQKIDKSIFKAFPILFKISRYLRTLFKLDIMQIILDKDVQLDIKFVNGKTNVAELLNQILHKDKNVMFVGNATMGVDSSLNGQLILKVKKEYLKEGFNLKADDANFIVIPIKIKGTLFNPGIDIRDIKKQLINEAIKNIGGKKNEKLINGLMNLFKKK